MERCLFLISFFVVLAGCGAQATPTDGDGDSDADGDGDTFTYETVAELSPDTATTVDLLFVIDNSGSMGEEQQFLGERFQLVAEELLHPDDTSVPAVTDLHIGVITTDMGTDGISLAVCSPSGDDGVLQNRGSLNGCQSTYSAADCERAECPWLVHSAEHPDDGTEPGNDPIWEDFGCVEILGTGGCGVEQPLEASYRALIERTAPGEPNEDFLRDGSLLAVIYLTDEDDCSFGDPSIIDPERDDLGPLNTRCALHEELLHPVRRYIDALRALRPDPDRLVVAAIAGVPVDGRWEIGDPVEALRALNVVDPEHPQELVKSCDADMGAAYAPVRMVELVYAFGERGLLASCCEDERTWIETLTELPRRIQERLVGICLPQAVPTDFEASCRLVEVLDGDRACPGAASDGGWQEDLGTSDDGRRRCALLRAGGDGAGWSFLPFSVGDPAASGCSRGRVVLEGFELEATSRLLFECRAGG